MKNSAIFLPKNGGSVMWNQSLLSNKDDSELVSKGLFYLFEMSRCVYKAGLAHIRFI